MSPVKKVKAPVTKKVKKVPVEDEEVQEVEEIPEAPSKIPMSMIMLMGNLFVIGGLLVMILGLMYDVIKGDQFSMDAIGLMQGAIIGLGAVGLIVGFVLLVMGNQPVPASTTPKRSATKKKKLKMKKK
jgi:hypothetical protein